MVQIGYLQAKFDADVANFIRDMGRAADATEKTQKIIAGAIGGINKAFGALGVAVGAGALFGRMIEESRQAEDAAKKVEAILRSTGGVAGVTAKQIDDLAGSLSKVTGLDDDVIKGGEAMLLTFKNIGKDVFPAATQAMLDMSETMGQDLKTSAIQLGKALNDPKEGISALQRIGITFTDAQKNVIKSLTETGQTAKAQAIILKEIQEEMGGTAIAARDTLSGAFKALDTAIGNLFETLGSEGNSKGLRYALEAVVELINRSTEALPGFISKVETATKACLDWAASLAKAAEAPIKEPPNFLAGFIEHMKLSIRMIQYDFTDAIGDAYTTITELTGMFVNHMKGQLAWLFSALDQIGKFLSSPYGLINVQGKNALDGLNSYFQDRIKKMISDWNDIFRGKSGDGAVDISHFYNKDYVQKAVKPTLDAIDDFGKQIDKKLDDMHKRSQKTNAYGIGKVDAGSMLGLPLNADVEAYMQRNIDIINKYDPEKVFAANIDKVDYDQLRGMRNEVGQLLNDVTSKIGALQAALANAGDDNGLKLALKGQIGSLQQLKKELESSNKDLDDQWKLAEKGAEALEKELDSWKKRGQEIQLQRQEEYKRGDEAIKNLQEETKLLQVKNSHDTEQIAKLEAEQKLGKLQAITEEQRAKLLDRMIEAQKALNEEKAKEKADQQIEQMKEANELLAAKVAGMEDEYQAAKKLREMLKDIEDPAKKAEYTQKYKDQLALEKQYKDQLDLQKKTLDDIKSSTAGYTQKQKELWDAYANKGIINLKQYNTTLEDLRKKEIETFQKGVKDWTNKIFDGFSRAITEGKKLKDVFKDLGKELGLLAAKKLLFEPMSNAISNWAGKIFGGTIFGAPGSSGSTGGVASAGGLGGLGGGLLSGLAGLFGGGSSGSGSSSKSAYDQLMNSGMDPNEAQGMLRDMRNGTYQSPVSGSPDYLNRVKRWEELARQVIAGESGSASMPPLAPDFTKSPIAMGSAGAGLLGPLAAPGINPFASGGGDKLSLLTDSVVAIRGTLDFVKTSTASGLAIRVRDSQGAEIHPAPGGIADGKKGSSPFSLLPNNSGNGGDAALAFALAKSLIGSSKAGPAWKVIMPDCPCGGMEGASPAGSLGPMAAPPVPYIPQSSYTPNAKQAALANGTYWNTGNNAPVAGAAAAYGASYYLSSAQTAQAMQQANGAANAQTAYLYSQGIISANQAQTAYQTRDASLLNQAYNGYRMTAAQAYGPAIQQPFVLQGSPYAVSVNNGYDAEEEAPKAPAWKPSGTPFAPSGASAAGTKNYKWSDWVPDSPNPAVARFVQDPKSDFRNWRMFGAGGDPPLNIPSIVGDRGPELFVPRQSGTILPNDRLKQIMGGSAPPVINLHDYTSTESQIDSIQPGPGGSWNISLRDAMAKQIADPVVQKQINRSNGTKSRGVRRT